MLQLGEGGNGDASTGEILAIAVAPEHQGRGVGRALLSQVEELARQYRGREIHLHTAKDNLFARLLFERAGYKVLGSKKRYYPQGQAAVKALSAKWKSQMNDDIDRQLLMDGAVYHAHIESIWQDHYDDWVQGMSKDLGAIYADPHMTR